MESASVECAPYRDAIVFFVNPKNALVTDQLCARFAVILDRFRVMYFALEFFVVRNRIRRLYANGRYLLHG